MAKRMAEVKRKTRETDVRLKLNLDGEGKYKIKTGIGFLDHMLELFAQHGLFDSEIRAKGDLRVDEHHLIEDIGISLGKAIKKALGNKKGIRRYGSITLSMDEALASVSLDISGRPYLAFNVVFYKKRIEKEFDYSLLEEFFRAVVVNAGITLHINLSYGKNNHHIAEAIFKGFGRALDQATGIDPRLKKVPSTKGRL